MNIILKNEQNLKEFKKWIKALRSGKYEQGLDCLQTKEGFCCLGVACKELIKNPTLTFEGYIFGDLPTHQEKAPKWLKVMSSKVHGITGNHITEYNDSYGFTFEEIADLLEMLFLGKGIEPKGKF